MNVAVLHGRLYSHGGGTRVAIETARVFDAPLYVGFVNRSVVPDDIDLRTIQSSWLDSVARRFIYHGPVPGRDIYDAQLFSHIPELASFDIVIVTQGTASWYIPTDGQLYIRYIHSPTRWLYTRWQTRDLHFLRRIYGSVVRSLIQQRVSYPDLYLANSELVARRVKRYLARDSPIQTVYPPVETEGYPDVPKENFILYLGRLDSSKRIGLCIRAAARANNAIVIAGEGDDKDRLERIADQADTTVTFLGYVSESDKQRLLSTAKATIFAGIEEDFGMVPIESMAAGTPVVGVNEGFTQFQIQDGETGILCDATTDSLADGIRSIQDNELAWSGDRIAEYARSHFGMDRFKREMKQAVEQTREDATITTTLE